MARGEPHADPTAAAHPPALDRPAISLVGRVDEAMVEKLRAGLADLDTDGDAAIEMTTPGGAADYARRMALDIAQASARRHGRLLFLGKTQVYSAGMEIMAAFPRSDRYLTADTVLLIHGRQLERTVQLSGPIRASLPLVDALRREIDLALELECDGFERLIAGSDITLDELHAKAMHNWYLTAGEALSRGLVARIVGHRTPERSHDC